MLLQKTYRLADKNSTVNRPVQNGRTNYGRSEVTALPIAFAYSWHMPFLLHQFLKQWHGERNQLTLSGPDFFWGVCALCVCVWRGGGGSILKEFELYVALFRQSKFNVSKPLVSSWIITLRYYFYLETLAFASISVYLNPFLVLFPTFLKTHID